MTACVKYAEQSDNGGTVVVATVVVAVAAIVVVVAVAIVVVVMGVVVGGSVNTGRVAVVVRAEAVVAPSLTHEVRDGDGWIR